MTHLRYPAHPSPPSRTAPVTTLKRHHRRLLLGGGLLLTVLLAAAATVVMWMSLQTFQREQRDALEQARQIVDRFLAQRNRAYVVSLNSNATLWATQRDALIRTGTPIARQFQAQGGRTVVMAAGHLATPWLALECGDTAMSAADQAAYLGMVEAYSAYMAATVAAQDSPTQLISYAYDPSGTLLAVAGLRSEAALRDSLDAPTRRETANVLMETAERGWRSSQASSEVRSRNGYLRSYFGHNPLTGTDALVTQMKLVSADGPFFTRLTFESLDSLRALLHDAVPGALVVMDSSGHPVMQIGVDRPRLPTSGEIQAALANGATTLRHGTTFIATEPVHGIDWTLQRSYTWADIWAAQRGYWAGVGLMLISLVGVLWAMLLGLDRRVFQPALADAARVQESEALSRNVIETAPVGLCLIDQHARTLIVHNLTLEHLAGQASANALDALTQRLVQEILMRGGDSLLEIAWSSEKQQPLRHLQVIVAASRYQQRAIWVCAVTDATAQNETQQRLLSARLDAEQAQHDAEAASRAKSAFVATISHEIRTPLNGVLGHLELLARLPLAHAAQRHVSRARTAADMLLGMVSDTLDLSRIEAGLMETYPVTFDPRELLQRSAALFGPRAEARGLQLNVEVDDGVGPAYIADAHRFAQILNNLVNNAIKFTPSGSIQLSLSTGRASRLPTLRVMVADSGIGMTIDEQARLFEPFSQAQAETARQYGGSGLGLALCRHLTDLLGGQIQVRSSPGRGSTFTVEVPVVATDAAPPASAPSPQNSKASARRGALLLVDDNEIGRVLTQQQLNALGYEVVAAADGAQALAAWQNDTFVAVLTDLNMPDMDGYTLARQLLADHPGIPVMALTATALDSDKQRARDAGMADLLVKPIDLARLDQMLQQHLRTAPPPPIATPGLPSPAVVEQMRTVFIEVGRRDLLALEHALAGHDIPTLYNLLHAFTGALAMLGETDSATQCQRVERLLGATPPAAPVDDVAQAMASVEGVLRRFECGR